MRKDWIRTDEEREFRRMREFHKQQRKFYRFSPYEQPTIHFPIVMRKKKRLLPLLQQHSVPDQRIAPVNSNKTIRSSFIRIFDSRFLAWIRSLFIGTFPNTIKLF